MLRSWNSLLELVSITLGDFVLSLARSFNLARSREKVDSRTPLTSHAALYRLVMTIQTRHNIHHHQVAPPQH